MRSLLFTYICLLSILVLEPSIVRAQNGTTQSALNRGGALGSGELRGEAVEMLYIFSYPVVGRTYLMGLYDYESEDLFLPVIELFDLLEISVDVNRDRNNISGTYLIGGESYSIDVREHTIKLGKKIWTSSEDKLFRRVTDIYMHADLMSEIFKLHFKSDINRLLLSLETPHVLPVIELNNRITARNNIAEQEYERTFHTLKYDRKYSIINGGMFDYNFGVVSDMITLQPNYNFQYVTGLEVFGGQFRGRQNTFYSSLNGWQSGNANYDWKFNIRNSTLLSEVFAGHLTTRGFNGESILGMGVTNQPIEPRQMFGYTFVDGITIPDSEVELFINDQLIDYAKADAQGYYRLDVPLRYGTTKVRVQVYTPTGELKTEEQQLQIPYNFAPKGVINYQIFGGYVSDEINSPLQDKRFAGSADLNIGLNNWLTLNAGYSQSNNLGAESSLFAGASARLFNAMLLDFEYVPNVWYRTNSSLVFGSANSLSNSFTKYLGLSSMNTRNANYSMINSLFYNFPFKAFSLGLRFSGITYGYNDGSDTRFTTDIFTQIGRFNLRFNYSDTYSFENGAMIMDRDMDSYKVSGTYSFAGKKTPFFKNTFLRSSVLFSQEFSRVDQVDFQLSRKFFKTGRVNINFSNSFFTNSSFIQVGLNFSLSKWARSSTNMRTDFHDGTVQQRIRGSIGVDHKHRYLEFTDRQQVGRSSATVRMFLDNDENGRYSRGDVIIPHKAVELDRSGTVNLGEDGLVRLSHLQSNYRYNLSVNRKSIPNPLLVPDRQFTEFSFISDPNQYKIIEIPFYQAGVIEGVVNVRRNDEIEGLGGLRLSLSSLDSDFTANLRTFRGGSFYQMDVPPGKYALIADRLQLEMLGLTQESGSYEVEVRKTANGDFVQGLEIILLPITDSEEGITYNGYQSALNEKQKVYEEELRFDLARALTYFTSAQQAYYLQRYDWALDYIEDSLELYKTPQSLSVKGSILYSMGDEAGAKAAWREAESLDPDLLLPNAAQTLLND